MIYRFCNNNARDLLKENRNRDDGNRKKRKFEGKIIVITGASSGIGRQAALDFVNEGAGSIILIARSESKLLELKRTLQVVNESKRADIVAFPCDISRHSGHIVNVASFCREFRSSRTGWILCLKICDVTVLRITVL